MATRNNQEVATVADIETVAEVAEVAETVKPQKPQKTKETKAERRARLNKEIWNEKRPIHIQRVAGSQNPDVIVNINGRPFQIKRGVTVEVPLPVFEELQRCMEAEILAFEFEQKQAEENI